MKKIRNVWEENKVLLVLALILIACIVIILVVSITFFYGTSKSVYGNRLDITNKVPLNDKIFTEIKDTLEKEESVTSVKTTKKGKIVYINIDYKDDTKMDSAKSIAEKALELFSEDELAVYDIEFSIHTKDYSLMGARNADGSGSTVWNNYNIDSESAN